MTLRLPFVHRPETACEWTRPRLSEYLDGALGPDDRARVRAHLAGCAACQAELDSLSLTVELLHRLPQVRVPRSFVLEAPLPRPAASDPAAASSELMATILDQATDK